MLNLNDFMIIFCKYLKNQKFNFQSYGGSQFHNKVKSGTRNNTLWESLKIFFNTYTDGQF